MQKLVDLFYTTLVILYVHEIAVILLYQQGKRSTGQVADFSVVPLPVSVWYSGKFWHL